MSQSASNRANPQGSAITAAIPSQQLLTSDEIRSVFERHIDRQRLETYRLPVEDPRTKVIVGLSGGADSSVLALFSAAYLSRHYPNLEFLFTDTKAEPISCYETLDKIEVVTGIPITRIVPEKGLFQRIKAYNGFIPSSGARWCTRELKIEPLAQHMAANPCDHGHISLAGIRYDEADREGISFQYTMENARAAFPFVDLEVDKAAVFSILDQTIGIPSTYRFRSRSGCFSCFFQRNSEAIGMLDQDPESFEVTEAYEKLSERDQQRWNDQPPSLAEAGIRPYYPVPAFIDIRKPERVPEKPPTAGRAPRDSATEDLFGTSRPGTGEHQDLFCAFALYVEPMLAQFGGREFTPGTYWQEFINLSTSLNGLRNSLGHYHRFKTTTPMPHADAQDMRIVIAQIRFPAGTVDTLPPDSDSFTWKSKTAYKQLRHLARHCQAVLQFADLERQLADAEEIRNTGRNVDIAQDAEERRQGLVQDLQRAKRPPGELVWEGLYTPKRQGAAPLQLDLAGIGTHTEARRVRENLEFDEVPRACITCSI